jgi:hypothetical protein
MQPGKGLTSRPDSGIMIPCRVSTEQEAPLRPKLLRRVRQWSDALGARGACLKKRFDAFLFRLAEAIANIRLETPTSWW